MINRHIKNIAYCLLILSILGCKKSELGTFKIICYDRSNHKYSKEYFYSDEDTTDFIMALQRYSEYTKIPRSVSPLLTTDRYELRITSEGNTEAILVTNSLVLDKQRFYSIDTAVYNKLVDNLCECGISEEPLLDTLILQ